MAVTLLGMSLLSLCGVRRRDATRNLSRETFFCGHANYESI
jgi:hypothetical protein